MQVIVILVLSSSSRNALQYIYQLGNVCDSDTTLGEVVWGLSEARILAGKKPAMIVSAEAKHGPIKARKFVRRFLECGGALEVQLQLIASHSSFILSQYWDAALLLCSTPHKVYNLSPEHFRSYE